MTAGGSMAVLERLALRLAPEPSGARVAVTDLACSSSHPLRIVDLHLGGGRVLELVAKDLSCGDRHKPAEVRGAVREVIAYERLLGDYRHAPGFFGHHGGSTTRPGWLFLERVRGPLLWQAGRRAWLDAARAAARLHRRVGGDGVAGVPGLLARDRAFFSKWPERARRFAASPRARALLARIEQGYDLILEELGSIETSLIHGELYPSNVLVRTNDPAGGEPVFVDWEMAGTGPVLLDLAALCTGLPEPLRTEVIAAYVQEAGRAWPDGDLARQLACCRLHLALQWLGWNPGWTAPDDQRTDWHAEAQEAWELATR